MTRAADLRHQVLTLDANGIPASHIAHALGIPVARVDRILDDHDAAQGVPHPDRDRAPVLEPLGGPAVVTSRAAVGGGRNRDPQRPQRIPRVKEIPGLPDLTMREGFPLSAGHGSTTGARNHRERGEALCDECVAGERERSRKSYASRAWVRKASDGEKPKPKPPGRPRKPVGCGTVTGFYRHRHAKQTICQPCRDAYNADRREKKIRDGLYAEAQCGTYRGWTMHNRLGEPVCDPCQAAYDDVQRRKGRPGRPRKPIVHGTNSGHKAHIRRGETPCDDCRRAHNEGRRKPIDHGSNAGYAQHRRRKEQPCEECTDAHAAATRQQSRAREPIAPVHGTPEGYRWHRRHKERPCTDCEPHGAPTRDATHRRRLALWEQGMTDQEIADADGTTRRVITRWRLRNGVPVHRVAR